MKSRRIILSLAALLLAVPSNAVFNEKDLPQTLSVLRFELKQEVSKRDTRSGNIDKKDKSQHTGMIRLTKRCNELALMLYSQNQDFTFDMTYALEEVTREYESFNERKLPFDDIMTRLDAEIDRYSRLVESLRRLPPQLHEIEELPDSLAYHNDSLKFDVPGLFRRQDGKLLRLDSLNTHGHRMAFYLDNQGQEDRDSCIHYATTLLKMYSKAKDRIVLDSEHYEDTSLRLKESYDYAHERYNALQRKMVTSSQDNFFRVLGNFGSYVTRAVDDAQRKYSRRSVLDGTIFQSEWRGPIITGMIFVVVLALVLATLLSLLGVALLGRISAAFRTGSFKKRKRAITLACGSLIFGITVIIAKGMSDNNFFGSASSLLLTLSAVICAILVSVLIRTRSEHTSRVVSLLMPIFFIGVVVISFRVMFLPNRLLNILLPPLALAGAVWQFAACRKNAATVGKTDSSLAWISFIVLAACAVMAWAGYIFLCIIVTVWWMFQLFAVEILFAGGKVLREYRRTKLQRRIEEFRESQDAADSGPGADKGEYIKITWLHDLLSYTVVPVLTVLSVPLCVRYALGSFDMTEICNTLFRTPFFDLADKSGAVILHVSIHKIIVVAALFFVFRFVSYFAKSFYRIIKLDSVRRQSGRRHIHTNEVNLTLANNIIAILVWGVYIVMVILLLKIPVGALSIVAAGLATGLGLAMKDILNNFIYGIQLMSGRLRVGDWIVCEGVRGRVSAISYQSTQIECEDGSVMSFLNTALFNNNFKNLTRNNSYEYIKIIVGIPYGENVEKVRGLLLDAMKSEQKKDAFGRDIVNLDKGVSVAVDDFGESSVSIAIKQHVLVTERWGYIARVKELVYNVFNENDISIPFNQLDIHVIQ